MKILRKKILGPVTLLHLIVLSASIAAVSGAAMLYYSWTIELTETQTNVTFYRWSDGATANYLELDYNFYADVTIDDRNASWGIWNRGVSNKTVYLWVDHIDFMNEYTIVSFYAQIEDDSGNIITWWTNDYGWANIGEPNAVSWNAIAGERYTLHIIIVGATSPADPLAEIVLRLKTTP